MAHDVDNVIVAHCKVKKHLILSILHRPLKIWIHLDNEIDVLFLADLFD